MTIDLWETPLDVTRSLTTPCLQNILRLRAFNVCHDKMDSTYISDFSPGPLLYIHLHPLHLFLNRGGLWGNTDDFTTSFLHFPVFSTALWDFANSRPVHFHMLSSHLFSVCLFFFPLPPPPLQWGVADAEIKVSPAENTELKGSPFKVWSR